MNTLGPGIWYTIHSLSFACDSSTKYVEIVLLIVDRLGDECRSAREWIENNPLPDSADRHERFLWSFKLHNSVNVKLGKKQAKIEEVVDLYVAHNRLRCSF